MKYMGNFFSLPNKIFLLGLSPGEAQRSGLAGKRRSSEMSEFLSLWAETRDMELATTRSGIKM